MVYEAVGFDPAAKVLAPSAQSFLDGRYAPLETTPVAIPLAAGWANFGSGFAVAAFELMDTRVFMRGLISNVGGALTANTFYVIATLPVGARPKSREVLTVSCGDPVSTGRVDVFLDGTMQFISQFAVPLNGYVSLSDKTFSTL